MAAPDRPPVTISPIGRGAAALIATACWLALALQLVVSIYINAEQGRTTAVAIWRYFGYFTILTNLLVAVTLSRVAIGRTPGGSSPRPSVLAGVMLTIAIVGVVYEGVLSGTVPAMGPFWWLADRTLHYAVPATVVLWWLAFAPKHGLTRADPPRWLAFPVAYFAYSLVRGAVDGWYPYFFIDVGLLGYGRALLNAAVLTVIMLVAGQLVVGAVSLTRKVR